MKKKSVGAVINHSAERGGEDLMKDDKRTQLESAPRPLAQRLESLRVFGTIGVRLQRLAGCFSNLSHPR